MASPSRKSMPLSDDELAQVAAFTRDSPERDALQRVSPVPLRSNSEGATLRALTVLGMRYVREQVAADSDLAQGYAELARQRIDAGTPEVSAGLRRNMRRLAATD